METIWLFEVIVFRGSFIDWKLTEEKLRKRVPEDKVADCMQQLRVVVKRCGEKGFKGICENAAP